jgi:DNA polymerase I-like protein with 3'-5' exonuclease and polymerase domains
MKHRTTAEARQLLLEGTLAFARIEESGIRVDKGYLDSAIDTMHQQVRELEGQMRADPDYKVWARHMGDKLKLGSRTQVGKLVFDLLGYTSKGATATGRVKADKTALEGIDRPIVQLFLQAEKVKKACSTYLEGIRREMVWERGGWFVHPSYNLNTAASIRSSCSDPNFQNVPIRDEIMAAAIRRCYIPRAGCDLHEPDFSTLEVRVAACYNHDPALIAYIKDKSTDMHRDTACRLFFLAPEQVEKKGPRDVAKNMWVFPNFYGAAYFNCAVDIWEALHRRKLKLKDSDILITDHLAKKGIKELDVVLVKDGDKVKLDHEPKPGSFGAHCKKVAHWFWEETFRTYTAWKQKWFEAWCRDGGFLMHTGFAVGVFGAKGAMGRNDVINYPIQGSAFHCLLWTIIRLQKLLRKYKMKTKIVGQIHDSFQADVPHRERQAFMDLARDVMTRQLPKAWAWLIVPLEIEIDVAPEGASWHDKKLWLQDGGPWRPADVAQWEEKFGPAWRHPQ